MYALLAQGSRYSLLGAPDGRVYRALNSNLPALEGQIQAPERHPLPPPNAPEVGGYKLTIDPTIPEGVTLRFSYFTDPVSRITIYVVFEVGRGLWHIRELRAYPGTYFYEES